MSADNIAAMTVGIISAALFALLLVAAVRSSRKELSTERRELENITAIFNALPRPKDEIPTTIRKAKR